MYKLNAIYISLKFLFLNHYIKIILCRRLFAYIIYCYEFASCTNFLFSKIFFFQKFITFVPDTLPPCPIGSKQRLYFIFHRIKTVTWQYVRKKSYDFLKIRLLHKNGVNLENHVNQPIFKKSKTRQKTHKFENHLTSCHTNIWKIDLDWSNLNFRIFKSPPASPLCHLRS